MENRNRFGLDKMNDELVNDILPVEINLPKNQKNLLATLIYISGIDKKDKNGFFYVDNKYLMEVLGVSEPTIISNANKLIEEGFIQRVTGKKNHPSKYLVTDLIKEYTKEYTKKYTKEYTKKYTKEYTKKYTKNFSKNFSKTVENFSQDKDIDKEKEKDKEYIFNIINNIIKENNIILINNIKNIIKKEIENIKEKENFSSINEIKEIETMRELNEQVNSLQDENAKLKSRLDNCAKQFKQMMQTIKQLQARVDYLESKQSSTNDKQQPSTTVEERKDCAEKKKAISSPTASDNDTTLTTIHQEEEKPTVAQQMPSMTIVTDIATPKEEEKQTEGKKNDSTVDVNEVMKDFANAVKQYEKEQKEHCNEVVLNEFKTLALQYIDEKNASYSKRKKVEERIKNYINYYKGKSNFNFSNPSSGTTTHQEDKQPSTTVEEERKDCAEKKEDASEAISSPTSPSNGSTLTTIHQEEEKPTVAQQMPLNGKELRYLDTMTNKQYATEAEAQKDGVNPWFLYDFKVGRCITEYTSPTSHSNDQSGIIVQDMQEKPTESEEMPLNERESFLLTVAQVFDDLRKRKYLNYQDKTDQLKEVWNYILSKEDILEQSDLEVCQKELKRILSQAIVASY